MMKIPSFTHRNGRTAVRIVVAAFAVAVVGMSSLAPLVAQKVLAADPSTINLIQLPGDDQPITRNNGLPTGQLNFGSCAGAFKSVPITQVIYNLVSPSLSASQAAALKSEINTTQPVIQFAQSDGVPVDGGTPSANGGPCGQYTLYFVGNNQYAAPQIHDDVCGRGGCGNDTYTPIVFNLTDKANSTGTLSYTFLESDNKTLTHKNTTVTMQGAPPSGGGGVSIGSIVAAWVDVATITITAGGPTTSPTAYNGETFTKVAWASQNETVNGNRESFYFLSAVGPNDTDSRANVVSGGGAPQCDSPIPKGRTYGQACGDNAGVNNCVPFIEVEEPLDFTGTSDTDRAARLAGEVGKLQSGVAANFYDYDSDCIGSGFGTGGKGPAPVSLTNNADSAIWFNYSTTDDAFATVFTDGDANEAQFIGTYTKSGNHYIGGAKGCGIIQADPTQVVTGNGTKPPYVADTGIFGVVWQLTTSCTSPTAGNVNVLARGGAAGEAGFTNASSLAPAPASPKLGCDLLGGLLNWLVCPIVAGAQAAAGALDNQINAWLNQDATAVFKDPGGAYYASWKDFRLIALSVIAIAAVIMVIAQAAGLELLDAYTIRKMLPRLVAVSIFIPLLWPLIQAMATIGFALGNDIRGLIYSALAPLGGAGNNNIGGGSGYVLTLLGTGGVLAFGWFGLLSFVLTALLAVFVGFVTITLVQVVAILVTIASPVILAAAILEPTRKLYVIGRDAIVGIYLILPILFGTTVAVFRGASAAAFSQKTTFLQIIAIILYLAPYFLLPALVRFAGGTLATIGGFVNDRSKGAFDRLKGYRSNQVKTNTAKMKSGDRFSNSNAVGRAFNQTTEGLSLGAQNGFGLTRRGRVLRDIRSRAHAEQAARSEDLQSAQFDDDGIAALYLSGGQSAGRAERMLTSLHQRQRMDASGNGVVDAQGNAVMDWEGGWNAERVRDAGAKARALGINKSNSIAAGNLAADNKFRSLGTGAEASAAIAATNHVLAEGNQTLEDNLDGGIRWHARTHGRTDLAGGSLDAAWGRSSMGELASTTPPAKQAFMEDISARLSNPQLAPDIRQRAAVQMLEMHTAVSHGPDADSQEAILAVEQRLGYDDAHRQQQSFEGFLADQLGMGYEAGSVLRSKARTWDGQAQQDYARYSGAGLTPAQQAEIERQRGG